MREGFSTRKSIHSALGWTLDAHALPAHAWLDATTQISGVEEIETDE
jgi:hypothetical protein